MQRLNDVVEAVLAEVLGDGGDNNNQTSIDEAYDLVVGSMTLRGAAIPDLCPKKNPKCDAEQPFRTFSGKCNNLKNGWWGARDARMRRNLQPAYADRKEGTPRGGAENRDAVKRDNSRSDKYSPTA